jgi:hypothetical protein
MTIGRKFNTLSVREYMFYIDNHKRYSDFNTLGLYRSIVEHENLTPEEKLEVIQRAHAVFAKTFVFLQLKDPKTYFDIVTLGRELTKGDEQQIWEDIRRNQQKILQDKNIKHRSFGDYSKHNCGDEHCPYNGLMIKQGSTLSEGSMHFRSDKHTRETSAISEKKHRKQKHDKREIQRKLNDN